LPNEFWRLVLAAVDVDRHDRFVSALFAPLLVVGGVGDLALHVATFDRDDRPTHLVDLLHLRQHQRLDFIGHLLDEPGTAQRVGHSGGIGFIAHDLLGSQRDAGGVLGRDIEGFVVTGEQHSLTAPQDSTQAAQSAADDVGFGFMDLKVGATHRRGDPQQQRRFGFRAEPVPQQPRPNPACRTRFRGLLQEISIIVELS
jgi:hypothetical protein